MTGSHCLCLLYRLTATMLQASKSVCRHYHYHHYFSLFSSIFFFSLFFSLSVTPASVKSHTTLSALRTLSEDFIGQAPVVLTFQVREKKAGKKASGQVKGQKQCSPGRQKKRCSSCSTFFSLLLCFALPKHTHTGTRFCFARTIQCAAEHFWLRLREEKGEQTLTPCLTISPVALKCGTKLGRMAVLLAMG